MAANYSRRTAAIMGLCSQHYGRSPVPQMTHDRQLVCFAACPTLSAPAGRAALRDLPVELRPLIREVAEHVRLRGVEVHRGVPRRVGAEQALVLGGELLVLRGQPEEGGAARRKSNPWGG